MDFEWDEAKRLSNIAKHQIDFVDVMVVFDGRPFLEWDSPYEGEARLLRMALVEGVGLTVVWTVRGTDRVRIISARRSRDDEERRYQALHGRRH
jgi:uncharacterized DUF497 family protein